MKRPRDGSTLGGIVPALCSALLPGSGQLINGETDKAIGVFAVWGVTLGLGILTALPIIGPAAYLVGGATWIYGVADGYMTGKKRR